MWKSPGEEQSILSEDVVGRWKILDFPQKEEQTEVEAPSHS